MQIPKTSDDKIDVSKMKKMNEYCGYEDYKKIVNEWCENDADLSLFLKQMAKSQCKPDVDENVKMYNMLMADVIDQRRAARTKKNLKRQQSWRTAFYKAKINTSYAKLVQNNSFELIFNIQANKKEMY